jgi:hypothetical protein
VTKAHNRQTKNLTFHDTENSKGKNSLNTKKNSKMFRMTQSQRRNIFNQINDDWSPIDTIRYYPNWDNGRGVFEVSLKTQIGSGPQPYKPKCKCCQSPSHSRYSHKSCLLNIKNITTIFARCGFKLNLDNIITFTALWEQRVEQLIELRYGRNYLLAQEGGIWWGNDIVMTDDNTLLLNISLNSRDFDKLDIRPNRPTQRVVIRENSRDTVQLNKLKKAGLVQDTECQLCCEKVPLDQIYLSKKCKCSYIYCNTCWHHLPEIREGVKQCPSCRVEIKAPLHAVASAAI